MPGPEHDSALEEADASDEKLREVHKRAMRRFDDCAWPTMELRRQSLEARRFVTIPGAQWEGAWGEQFEKSIKVEIPKVQRGLRKIETDYRDNRIVPDFRPDGEQADEETADTLDGLHRADSYRFKSQQARDNAVFEAISGGFGAYRLTNEWEDEGDKDNDYQRVNPACLIVDADQSVFFDGNAKLYDKSDARFAFIRTAMTIDAFEDEFGDERQTTFPEGVSWRATDWFTPEIIAVAEYYEIEEVSEALWIMVYTLSGEERRIWSSDLEEGELSGMVADGWTKRRQNRKRRRVHKYVLSGAEVLEDQGHIAGEFIPIVPIYGQRYFVENMERWKGYVQDKMDPQRLYNSNVSKLAETNSLSPREVPIFAPEQITPTMAEQWSRANIDRLPYLLADVLRNEDGSIAQAGPIGKIDPPQLSPALAALLQIANQDLMEDMEDGADTVKANTSADAMDIAATRVDAKSGIYLDNIRQSVQREGEIYLSMAKEVYTDDGRKVETMDEDGGDGTAVLKQAMTDRQGRHRVINDLAAGRYKVIASVTEATATRRDKTARSMLNTAQIASAAGDTELAQIAILTAVMNQDGEGTNDMQAHARKKLVALGVIEPNEEEQKAMDEAAGNAKPDPIAQVAEAQAADFAASAELKHAKVGEALANTGLKKAQAISELADAHAGLGQRVAASLPAPSLQQTAQGAQYRQSSSDRNLPPVGNRWAVNR